MKLIGSKKKRRRKQKVKLKNRETRKMIARCVEENIVKKQESNRSPGLVPSVSTTGVYRVQV